MIIMRSLYNFIRLQKYNIFFKSPIYFLEKNSELIIIDFNFQEKTGVLLLNKNNITFKIPSNLYPMSYLNLFIIILRQMEYYLKTFNNRGKSSTIYRKGTGLNTSLVEKPNLFRRSFEP